MILTVRFISLSWKYGWEWENFNVLLVCSGWGREAVLPISVYQVRGKTQYISRLILFYICFESIYHSTLNSVMKVLFQTLYPSVWVITAMIPEWYHVGNIPRLNTAETIGRWRTVFCQEPCGLLQVYILFIGTASFYKGPFWGKENWNFMGSLLICQLGSQRVR